MNIDHMHSHLQNFQPHVSTCSRFYDFQITPQLFQINKKKLLRVCKCLFPWTLREQNSASKEKILLLVHDLLSGIYINKKYSISLGILNEVQLYSVGLYSNNKLFRKLHYFLLLLTFCIMIIYIHRLVALQYCMIHCEK